MKLIFTKLETNEEYIKVSFDGVNWRPYEVADIKNRGGVIEFSEEDCPDLTKIKIKGKFARFNSVESVSDVELEQGLASKELAESVQDIKNSLDSCIKEETDPGVPNHVKSITLADINSWNGKLNANSLSGFVKGTLQGSTLYLTIN